MAETDAPPVELDEDVYVLPSKPAKGQLPGKIKGRSLHRWLAKGFVRVNPDGSKYGTAANSAEFTDGKPKANASREEWVTYAKSQGLTDEDLIVDGKELGRDEIRGRFDTPAV